MGSISGKTDAAARSQTTRSASHSAASQNNRGIGGNRRVSRYLIRGSSLLCLTVLTCFAAAIVLHSRRVDATEQQLKRLHAQYRWDYESATQGETVGLKIQRVLASWYGNAAVSEISGVHLTNGDPTDGDLEFLEDLQYVKRLEVLSDRATDETIRIISGLANLSQLTIAGEKFSVLGLLQLRDASNLCQLAFDFEHFSPIEMAVIRKELAGVKLFNIKEMRHPLGEPSSDPMVEYAYQNPEGRWKTSELALAQDEHAEGMNRHELVSTMLE